MAAGRLAIVRMIVQSTLLRLFRAALIPLLALSGALLHAQTIYGVGQAGTAAISVASSTALFTINPNTGASTQICALAAPSTANTVSSLDGRIYYITRETTARLFSIDPATCVNTFLGNTLFNNSTLATLRATHCPDGRFYAMSNTTQFYELSSANGATLRTLNWTGLPTGGSGDFACTNNGDLYVLAADGTANYNLYRATSASFQAVANGSSVVATNVGDLGLAGAPNGITEAPSGLAGCAASPNPCLLVSTGDTRQIWRVNSVTAAATNAGTTGNGLTDLSRSFPVDLSFSKSVTPTTALQGQTVFYTLTASNPGPAVVQSVQIQDTFPAGIASASWACTVTAPGSATLVSTSCGATPSGTGNINQAVSLSLNGSIRYDITATLSSGFTGTLSNSGRATITVPVTDPTPGNNSQTATSTVSPATNLSISKSNAAGTVTAGSVTSYTITATNSGPGTANNAVISDPATAGLNCTAVSCSVGSGGAVCPVAPALSVANLQGSGVTVATFPANSSLNFQLTCTVTATGLP